MSDQYHPPPGPPPAYGAQQHASTGRNPFRADPPGYEAPPGPPSNHNDQYAPPSGPPPSHGSYGDYAPPQGPPPSQMSKEPEPPPYSPWMSVPDNALLPPPPSFKQEVSPTANANWDDAARGHAWCRSNPLWPPQQLDQRSLSQQERGDIALSTPPNPRNLSFNQPGPGRTYIRTTVKCCDTPLLSTLPLYTANNSNPVMTGKDKIIYFELHVVSMGRSTGDSGIAIGFLAPPYPSWRLPGWHRASLGVHGDDGRRYVDDSFGGRDFVPSFRKGDIVGIGMHFRPPYAGGPSGSKPRCEVFFTRNGRREDGWDLHEERDRDTEEGDVEGLEGSHDLLAAVGVFGEVEFEVRFRREDWRFKP